jgi:hypothetical protein
LAKNKNQTPTGKVDRDYFHQKAIVCTVRFLLRKNYSNPSYFIHHFFIFFSYIKTNDKTVIFTWQPVPPYDWLPPLLNSMFIIPSQMIESQIKKYLS